MPFKHLGLSRSNKPAPLTINNNESVDDGFIGIFSPKNIEKIQCGGFQPLPMTPNPVFDDDKGDYEEYQKQINDLELEWFDENQKKFKELKWFRRPNRWVLYLMMGLHSLSISILMSPMMVLMLANICSSPDYQKTESTDMGQMDSSGTNVKMLFKRMDMTMDEKCDAESTQKMLSNIQTGLQVISGVLGFFLSGKFGQISDKYGRVLVFRILSIINLLQMIGLIYYFQFFGSFNESLMIMFTSIGSFAGGMMTLISTGNGYLNDIIEAEKRTIALSLQMSFVYLAVGFGPLLGSLVIMLSNGNNIAPLYFAFVSALLSLTLCFTLLIETRHPLAMQLARERFRRKNASGYNTNSFRDRIMDALNSVWNYLKPIKRLWLRRTTKSHSAIPRINVINLILIDIVSMAATDGTMHVMTLYCIQRFGWSGVQVGYYMSIGGFGKFITLMVFAPLLLRFLKKTVHLKVLPDSVDSLDKTCIVISLVFILGSSICAVLASTSGFIYLSAVLQSFSGLVAPTIQAAVIKYSSNTESGEMFGAMALVRHLAMLILPVFFLQVYSHTVEFAPSLFLYIPLGGSVVTLLLAVFFVKSYNSKLGKDPAANPQFVVIDEEDEDEDEVTIV